MATCYMTKTRLMGALVGYIDYLFDGRRIVEFYHIEIEEYGIDRFEQLVEPTDYDVLQMRHEMLGRMGGAAVPLSEDEFLQMITFGVSINMRAKTLNQIIKKSHWFPTNPNVDLQVYQSALLKVIENINGPYAFIHYFLMRYLAQDKIYLHMTKLKIAMRDTYYTLLRNQIEERNGIYYFSGLLLADRHYTMRGAVKLDGGLIAGFKIKDITKATDLEAAMLLRRAEFINVYKIGDENLESHLIREHKYLAPTLYPNGRLYIKYRSDDRHVSQKLFFLNGDVEVYIYITDSRQLILAGDKSADIEYWDEHLKTRFAAVLQHYESFHFESSILYDFILSDYDDFDDFVGEYGE